MRIAKTCAQSKELVGRKKQETRNENGEMELQHYG